MVNTGKSLAIALVLISLIPLVAIQPVTAKATSELVLLWKNHFSFPPGTKDAGRHWSSPTVMDGMVYIGATSVVNCFPYYPDPPPDYICDWWSDFYAFNASNGAIIWSYRDETSLIQKSCTVNDGIVFFGVGTFDNGAILALNASSGALLWSYTVCGEISSPEVANGIVYFTGCASVNSTLYALNATNGNRIWYAPDYGRSSPKIANSIHRFTE